MPDSDAKSLPTRGEGSGQHSGSSHPSSSSKSAATTTGGSEPPPSGSPSSAPRPGGAEALIGTILGGRYKIEKLLGEGGMGAVYQAEHTHMRKRLAVKVLHPEMSRLPEVVARFEREAMAAAHIDHPNVAAATDFGKLDDGSFFLVLEFVEGQSLRDAMNHGRLDVGRALRILRQVSGALGQAHALGIVHRDLKPENVMLVERNGDPDFVKVLDFGIAKVPVGDLAKEAPGSVKGPVLTQLGMVYGTPEYMAPEQALGQNVDPRADIYALGVLTFEMLAGVRPFDHESKVTLLGMHVTAPVPSIAQKSPEANVAPEVEAVIIRMLAKEATHRYSDAKELVEVLDSIWQPAWGTLPGPASQMNPRASQLGMTPHSSGRSLPNLGNAQTQVAIPSASQEILGQRSALKKIVAKVKENPKPLIFGGLLISAFFGVFLLKGAFDRTTHDVTTTDDAGNVVVVTMLDAQVVVPALDAQVAAATELVDKGDNGTAISQLQALEKQAPERADIHRALFRAYTATQDTADAVQELKLLFAADPSTTKDPALQTSIRNAALDTTTEDAAFAIMQANMGSDGPDTLYNIAYDLGGQYPEASERARKALGKQAVRALATPGLVITLQVKSAGSCGAKKALLPQASSVGDKNTLAVLKTWTPTKGCGFLNQRDCYPCIHKDGSLSNAIRDIEARVNK